MHVTGHFCKLQHVWPQVTCAADHADTTLSKPVTSFLHAGHLRSALAPKLDSALALGSTLGLHPVRATLAFSSVASLFGSAGQGNYAAANGAMEAWASSQASCGLATTAVQWGAWAAGDQISAVLVYEHLLSVKAEHDDDCQSILQAS